VEDRSTVEDRLPRNSCRQVCCVFVARVWQEAYGLLSKYEIQVTKEEMDMVDTMRYKFKNIIAQSVSTVSYARRTDM